MGYKVIIGKKKSKTKTPTKIPTIGESALKAAKKQAKIDKTNLKTIQRGEFIRLIGRTPEYCNHSGSSRKLLGDKGYELLRYNRR